MDERPQQIIIKKVKKNKGGGAHGGSWKVAYADFVTAMMAFFLMLWLLSMVSDEKRASLSVYFEKYSIFQSTGNTAITFKESKLTDPNFMNPKEGSKMAQRGKKTGELSHKTKQEIDARDEELVKKIRASVDEKMAGVRDQILVDVIEDGIRIQIIDTDGSTMFPSGSFQPTQKAKQILKLVSANIKEIPGRIVVEGHTDSAPYKSGQNTNWELSTSRASSARKEIEANGVDTARIARVVGYADAELLIPLDPLDQRNRRISIIILNEKK
ncbi:MAG: chemotaxis protein [Deltaproteobacteria bacterium HGW-Deltaproteobacteria-10]|nr:MAG: chemotaxis protein [Deltaproteobacteria bacterium HGW-Deltaproteobacteria-10]